MTSSIGIGSDGFPVMVHLENLKDDLRFVHCTSADCSTFDTPIVLDGGENVYFTGTTGTTGFPFIIATDV